LLYCSVVMTTHDRLSLNMTETNGNLTRALNVTSTFVFAPVLLQQYIKIILVCVMCVLGLYGLIANAFILYHSHRQVSRKRRINNMMNRWSMDYFIQSLALSNVLCFLIVLPMCTSEMFIKMNPSNAACKIHRYVNTLFPSITICNYVVIGIDRYLSVFCPYFVLSSKMCRMLVAAAWIMGGLLSAQVLPSYKLVYYDIDGTTYTLVCKYDFSLRLQLALFLSYTVVIYVIPCFLLAFINIRILMFLRRRRKRVALALTVAVFAFAGIAL